MENADKGRQSDTPGQPACPWCNRPLVLTERVSKVGERAVREKYCRSCNCIISARLDGVADDLVKNLPPGNTKHE